MTEGQFFTGGSMGNLQRFGDLLPEMFLISERRSRQFNVVDA